MKNKIIFLVFTFLSTISYSQYENEASPENPYGKPHPDAPTQIKDYKDLIGTCNCKSISRKPDQSWAEPVDMKWTFKYIMNGMAVQDETLKADGNHSGSLRQFIADSSKWYVHYYSSASPTTKLSTWDGNKNKDGDIVLYRKQKAPNGADGFFRLTFYDISKLGYKWVGEWVNEAQTVTFPTWKIECTWAD